MSEFSKVNILTPLHILFNQLSDKNRGLTLDEFQNQFFNGYLDDSISIMEQYAEQFMFIKTNSSMAYLPLLTVATSFSSSSGLFLIWDLAVPERSAISERIIRLFIDFNIIRLCKNKYMRKY